MDRCPISHEVLHIPDDDAPLSRSVPLSSWCGDRSRSAMEIALRATEIGCWSRGRGSWLISCLGSRSPASCHRSIFPWNRCLVLVMLTPLNRLEPPETTERRPEPETCFVLESIRGPRGASARDEHESRRRVTTGTGITIRSPVPGPPCNTARRGLGRT